MIIKNNKFKGVFCNLLCSLLILCIFCPFQSSSHGPSRQKIKEQIIINSNISKVWSVISDFSKFDWNEDVKKVKVEGDGIGSVRTLTFEKNAEIQQSLEKLLDEKKIISWRVKKTDPSILPVNSYQATILLKDIDGKTEVTYKAGFYRGFMGNDPPEELNDKNSKAKARKFVLKSLNGLKTITEK